MADGLFRDEALEHHTGARTSGDVLRIPPSWTRWTFAFLVAVFVGAAAYATLGSVTIYTHGLAAIRREGSGAASVTVYFPERDRARLTEGLVVRIENPSDRREARRAKLVSVAKEPVPLTEALAKLGITVWPAAPPPSRLAIAGASLEDNRASTGKTDEVVAADAPIGEARLITLLFPALRSSREE